MPSPTHLLFDFFGTLVDYSESRVEQGYENSHQVLLKGGASVDYAGFLAQWSATFDEHEARALASRDEFSMDAVCTAFLRQVLPGEPNEHVVALYRDTFLGEWNQGVHYISGVSEMLAALAQTFKLVLVTNTHHADLVHGHLRAMNVAQHFIAVVTSVEHGKRKPSACIFERALKVSMAKLETSVYIGDSFNADYAGAVNAGLRCLLIDPGRRYEIPPHARLDSILDLPARFVRAGLGEINVEAG